MLDRTTPTYVAGEGEDDDISGDEAVSPKVGNIPWVLRLATTRLGVVTSVTGHFVSSPSALAVISVGGKSCMRPSASLLLADVLSANAGVPGAAV